jgi:uridine phosphorylase
MGGLTDGWRVGDVLVPSLVVGRDGVSQQLSRNKPIRPDAALSSALCGELESRIGAEAVRSGTLVSTTTIALERKSDIARWRRCGYAGVEMECAATTGTASHFGVPTAGAFVLMDNLAANHTVFALSEDDYRRINAGKDATLRAAVAAALTAIL